MPLNELLGLRPARTSDQLGSFLTRAATVTILRYAFVAPQDLQARTLGELATLRRQDWTGIRMVAASSIAPQPGGGRRQIVEDRRVGPRPGRRWTRRSVLVLGAASAGLLLARTRAEGCRSPGRAVLHGAGHGPAFPAAGSTSLGLGWQWRGRGESATSDGRAAPVVLARADIASVDPQEIVGLLLANATAGSLPGLELGARRVRSMPGGGDQTRIDLAYAAARALPFHGTMLIATRPEPPAAVWSSSAATP